ncbi:hypothetical protein EV356DRAFT_581388 [Viridothelium virens]|uniref:Apple domain-containing protein n=1 Tax=Viridothelium virens TaxID=1048519 RepID=A0A6A6GSV2_VIRVR|nr:hypothetical protein EV356DRAFT_581388 [Viridothelium virens]
MRSFYLLPALAALGRAHPKAAASCTTTTVEVIVPTSTYTFLSTHVVTTTPTTAENLGTFTDHTTISDTTTVETITSTSSVCHSTDAVLTKPDVSTIYTSASAAPRKRSSFAKNALFPRQNSACTVTTTFTTTYGVTYTYIPASKTSTFTDYTDFTQASTTITATGGHAYVVATATATTSAACGVATSTDAATTSTTTQDARCAPSAMVSQLSGFGLNYLEETPDTAGAVYVTSAEDASSCCQLCADADDCASSAWDIRTNQCRLQFTVANNGQLECGQVGLYGVSEDGPDHPMAPGTGWYLAAVCGQVEEIPGKPDDGS